MLRRGNETCAVCRMVRTYLLIAVPLLAMVGFSSLSRDEGTATPWFAQVELISFLAALSVISLVLIVGYRAYDEFWTPRKKKKKLDSLVRQLTDEGDDY